MAFHAPLHRDRGHPENAHDLALRRRTVDDQLCREQTERRQIVGAMREDRQVPVEIHHLAIARAHGELLVDRRDASGNSGNWTWGIRPSIMLRLGHASVPGLISLPIFLASPGRDQEV